MVCAHPGVQFISQLGKLWGEILPTTKTNPTAGYQRANLITIDVITFFTCSLLCQLQVASNNI